MFDHLSKGRFILGISPGNLRTDAEALGTFDEDRGKLFAECIDAILEIWSRDPPYEIDLPGNRFKVSTARSADLKLGLGYLAQPYQQPRPEIVGTVVAPFSKGVIAMGRRDFHPLSANFLMPQWLPSHWANYQEGKTAAGVAADPGDWRVARSIFVADDETVAARYAREADSPYMFYFQQLMAKFFKTGRTSIFKENQAQPDHTITLDYVADRLIWHGTVDRIVDHILSLRDAIGDFGELVYAGMDWLDPGLARRSMELMATEVMPRVNHAIGTAQPAAVALGGRR
jgi:alkanesulfonate monooxygenase SsuD/methylene tetrahydromethanopterin reductase-like flavin-dependent oxidoreductase (luciferase family)